MITTVNLKECARSHERIIDPPVRHGSKKQDPVTFWMTHSEEMRRRNCEIMKASMIWPVFAHRPGTVHTNIWTWDLESTDLCMADVHLIGLLEGLADAFKKVADQPSRVREVIRIGCNTEKVLAKIKHSYIKEAMNWVKSTGHTEVCSALKYFEYVRTLALQSFFSQYTFFLAKMAEDGRALSCDLKHMSCNKCQLESESFRHTGNDEFVKGLFIDAENSYTSALLYSPANYVLYGNRALCYMRLGIYGKAMCDGRKATILKSSWPKGHYRFCEAMYTMGIKEFAIRSNERAQRLCKDSPEGIRDLVQQHKRFTNALQEDMDKFYAEQQLKKNSTDDKRAAASDHMEFKSIHTQTFLGQLFSPQPPSLRSNRRRTRREDFFSASRTTETLESFLEQQRTLSETSDNMANKGAEDCDSASSQKKGKTRVKSNDPSEKFKGESGKSNASKDELQSLHDKVKSLASEGYQALADQRFYSAEDNLSKILEILLQIDLKRLHLKKLDYVLFLYGHANALLGIRKCVELERAEKQFKEIIQQHSKEKFNCLAFYGIGNVYFKQNRFSDALGQYVKSKTMLKHKMHPGLLNWPTTAIIIDETRQETLEVLLDNCIEECLFPPKPDAICRYEQCLSFPKIQIYFTDPDFKGFIRLTCCHCCIIEYHVCCWKKMKAAVYADKNDKDFLKYTCLTPDCSGLISQIVIYDSSGEVKCEFEDKTIRKKEPQKCVKQKSTSKKTKAKHENKFENKSEKKKALEEEQVDQSHGGNGGMPEEKALPNPVVTNGYLVPKDPLLLQVVKKQQLIVRGCPLSFAQFWHSVAVWKVVGVEEMNDLERNPSQSAQSHSKMKNLLYHLYKVNDRVKTRVLLYLLHTHHELISCDLQKWLRIVDEKGLQAAEEFRLYNEEYFKSAEVQEFIHLWNESYGKNINYELSDCSAGSLYDILSNMSIKDFRCFVWFLEENRNLESVVSLGKELDKYFQQMDVPCDTIPTYSLEIEELNNKCVTVRAKHKKKKQNQPKPIYKLSGAVSTIPHDEDIFTEEDTLSLLDPYEPFVVPEFLREDLDEFQPFYNPSLVGNRYEVLADDSMDPVRETLYEYFSQILEEHGPLKLDDDILIREYRNFPEQTHKMVEESGGLKDFLLESYEFTLVEDKITLSYNFPYLGCSRQSEDRYHLNPAAAEFRPSFNRPTLDDIDLYCDPSQIEPSSSSSETDLSVPRRDNSFSFEEYSDMCSNQHYEMLSMDSSAYNLHELEQDLDDLDDELSISSSESEESSIQQDTDKSPTLEKPYTDLVPNSNMSSSGEREQRTVQTAIVSVQVDIEVTYCEVNTDAFQPFESQQGDILRMEKEQIALVEQLRDVTEKYENMQSRYKEEMASLEEQIKDTVQKNEVIKTELNWLQQVYDAEGKKWHQEKKEHQEKIKSLKSSIKSTIDNNDRCSKNIEEKKKQYGKHIDEFMKIHYNKFESEKAKLEKHVKKCEEECEETKQRTIAAQVIELENRKQSELQKLKFKAATLEQNISMLRTVGGSNPTLHVMKQISDIEALLINLKKEMDTLQTQINKKINSTKSGLKKSIETEPPGCSPPSAPVSQSHPSPCLTPPPSSTRPALLGAKPSNPQPAKSPANKTSGKKKGQAKEANKAAASTKPKTTNPASSSSNGAAGADQRRPVQPEPRLVSPAKTTVFDKIIQELHDIFPVYKSAELANFIRDFRVRNNGTLAGLTHEDLISRVTEHILDYQARTPAPPPPIPIVQSAPRPAPPGPQPKQPWKVVTAGPKNKWQTPLDLEAFNEDPCIICHEELKSLPVHRLDCGHYFHKDCIKKWLNTQSTCPTCREHALLPEDFPVLAGRMRNV